MNGTVSDLDTSSDDSTDWRPEEHVNKYSKFKIPHDHKRTRLRTIVGSGYSKALKTKLVYSTVPHDNSEEKGTW